MTVPLPRGDESTALFPKEEGERMELVLRLSAAAVQC